MSGFLSDVRSVGISMRDRTVDLVAMVRRTAPGPALARLSAAVGAATALVVAVPSELRSVAWFGGCAVLAIGVGLSPRTRWATIVILLVVAEWLLATLVYGDPATLARTGALAAALYVMHSAAALAAVLPYDAIVAPGVVARWLMRTGTVLVCSLAIALGGMAILQQLRPVPTLVAPVLGATIAAAVAGLLAWHVRRR